METINEACPTEILIDLNEKALPLCVNSKKVNASNKSEIFLNNEGSALFNIKQENHQSLLDVSPFMVNNESKDSILNMAVNTDVEKCMKLKEVVDGCPTAILVDVSSFSSFGLKQPFTSNNIQLNCSQEGKLNECKSLIQDLKDTVCTNLQVENGSKDYADDSPKLNGPSNLRKRWKTPSPQSMSRIAKEASKIIDNLNSSGIFDEDSLLTEETLPIPINFDIFEDSGEQDDISKIENRCQNEILNSSVDAQTQTLEMDAKIIENPENFNVLEKSEIEKKSENEALNSPVNVQGQTVEIAVKITKDVDEIASFPDPGNNIIHKKFQNSPVNNLLETEIVEEDLKDSKEVSCNSKELFSPEVHSDSLNNSGYSVTSDGTDDVFFIKQNPSEDKENIQKRKHKILFGAKKTNSKTPCKAPFKPKSKLELGGTLRNLSNITYEATNSIKSNFNKNVITPRRNMSLATTKVIQPTPVKQQLKKTISTGKSYSRSKGIPESNLFQDAKEVISSSVQKHCLTVESAAFNSDSLCKPSSLDHKELTACSKLKTPSRRYSTSTPLRSTSAIKPPSTPTLHSFQNPPRYTPQSARNSRLSLSKSWQHPVSTPYFLNSKCIKQQNCTSSAISTNASTESPVRVNSVNPRRQSFSQSMSAASFQSLRKGALTSSYKSKCNKLNLPPPSPIGEERKLARKSLFPSVVKK